MSSPTLQAFLSWLPIILIGQFACFLPVLILDYFDIVKYRAGQLAIIFLCIAFGFYTILPLAIFALEDAAQVHAQGYWWMNLVMSFLLLVVALLSALICFLFSGIVSGLIDKLVKRIRHKK